MNAAWVCLVGLGAFALGYLFYSRRLAGVFQLRAEDPVPARTLEDGIDYVPTPRPVLFGHHYASIAGAAPIIGPAIAVVWGWLPAFVWIVVGSVFLGAVHDFSILVLSMRHGGKSVGQVSAQVIGGRARPLFLLVIFFLVTLVIAVFARAIATLFVATPGSVLPVNLQILVAIGVGWLCYRRQTRLLVPSLVALVTLYAAILVGEHVPLRLGPLVGESSEHLVWVVLLLVYSFAASVMPVWLLLQPRDYINSHQLFVGLGALILGIFVAQPTITAPAIAVPPGDAPSILPFLFVTVACGAISGFHGLVASGTTSKQIAFAPDARPVGYGAMLGEAVVALVATLAVSAGLADWASHYHSYAAAAAGGVSAFVEGAATFLAALGLGSGTAQVLVAVMVISFAATSLDTGVRIQRYILSELGELYGLTPLTNRYVASGVAVVIPFLLYLTGTEGTLWPLFGATNQILAGLSLVVVTVWLKQSGRAWIYTGAPMLFVLVAAGVSLFGNLAVYLARGQYLLLGVGTLILALEAWIVLEGARAVFAPKPATRGEPTA
jgi:carbon starvation protein